MNKRQKVISKMFKMWFPMAVKNSHGNVLDKDRNKEYRKFKWLYSDENMNYLLEELKPFKEMKSKQIEN